LASITFVALSFARRTATGTYNVKVLSWSMILLSNLIFFVFTGTKVHMQPVTSEQTALICSDDGSKVDMISKNFNEAIMNEENSDSSLDKKTEEIENIFSESKLDSSEVNTSDQGTDASRSSLNAADSSVIEEDEPVILDANDMTPETIFPDSEEIVANQPEEDSDLQDTVHAPAMADPLPVENIASEVVILESGDVVETQEVAKESVSLDQKETVGSLNEIESLQENEPIGREEEGGQNVDVDKSEANFEKTKESFSRAGIPAPSLVPAALQVPPGNVLVPAVVDQHQSQAFAALQALKVYLSCNRNPKRPKANNSLYICWY
jgi:hypothetical protein